MKPLITNVQRFCVKDGPGIRTTVFFKGCTLTCPWCANPENKFFNEDMFYIDEKCNTKCQHYNNKTLFFPYCDKQECLYGALGLWGRYYSEEELYSEIVKDINYYMPDGGVTFSGGEPLLFLPQYEEMIRRLKREGINICVESALFIDDDKMKWAIKYVDTFIVDIKILDKRKCKKILHGDIEVFFRNMSLLFSDEKKKKNVIMRYPVVKGFNDDLVNISLVIEFIKKYQPNCVELFDVHNLAVNKYKRLGREYSMFEKNDENVIKGILEKICDTGVKAYYLNL